MKVHFSASIEHIDKRISIHRAVCDAIRSHGDELMRDWVEEAYSHRTSRYSEAEAVNILKLTREAISSCDVAIFEVSDQSFGIGYQAALAASLQKPLLILQQKDSRPLGAVGMGVDSPLRDYSNYSSEKDIEAIIKKFIEKNDVSTKDLRFNMVLERDLLYYLTNESEYTGVSKSQIVRKLIRQAAKNRSDSL